MKHLIFFDSEFSSTFYPLSLTRPVADLRIGALKIHEKWAYDLNASSIAFFTEDHLQKKFPFEIKRENLLINASVLPSQELLNKIKRLKLQEALMHDGKLIAAYINEDVFNELNKEVKFDKLIGYELSEHSFKQVNSLSDIIEFNSAEIILDFRRLKSKRKSQNPDIGRNQVFGDGEIFIEENATVLGANLDTRFGPIYIGADTEVLPGSNLQGPCAILDGALITMGANLYQGTTIGLSARAGGEIKNSILGDFSNKAHSGYLGDSIIGNWCNLGADTNTSNLKNNYSEVAQWSYSTQAYIPTGKTKCGTVMGDYVRTGINTMLNTGTVIGVCCNIARSSFPDKYTPSFSWITDHESESYILEKAIQTIAIMMTKRERSMTPEDRDILTYINSMPGQS